MNQPAGVFLFCSAFSPDGAAFFTPVPLCRPVLSPLQFPSFASVTRGGHTYSSSALGKIEINRHLLKKTAHALHNSKQSDNFAIEIDEKHALDSFCPRFVGAPPLPCGSPPGLSRRHACFTFISPHYENSDSLFATPAGTQRLFPPHQRTHRGARHVACGAHRHPSRAHHAHRQRVDTRHLLR